jgi:RNA 3'-terminal phosphate cyclase (ATP)
MDRIVMLDIDGSYGEGGGQVLRTAVAAAAATATDISIKNIRARRQQPGLAAQHIAAVKLVAEMCGAQTEGLSIGSGELTFKPGPLKPGNYTVDVGTAGSIPLVLQAGVLAASFSPKESSLTVTGGTDVRMAPSIDYFQNVLVPLLAKMGIDVCLEIRKRGYYPRGGGEIVARISPPPGKPAPLRIEGPGRLLAIKGNAHVVNLGADIMKRMATSALAELKSFPARAAIEEVRPPGVGEGTGITIWALTEHSVLGTCALGERGLRAENIGAIAGRELSAEIKAGASVDIHAADQLVPYMALGGRGAFTVRNVSSHLETVIWLMRSMAGVSIKTEKRYGLQRVEC